MLSVAMVCRNNEGTIGRALDSVAGMATEVVAVDSGSTDGTIGTLERHGARVIRAQWQGYVATKQLALDACTRPWVLCLDSDESVEPDLRRSIERALARDEPGIDGFAVNRKVYYRGRPLNYAWQPEYRLRLVRRGRARWAGLDPHDTLELVPGAPGPKGGPGAVRRLEGTLRHDSVGTWAAFLAKQADHARVMAESLHRQGRRGSLVRLAVSPVAAFLKQVVLKQAWRDGWPGWAAAAATAAGALIKHVVLLELSRTGGSSGDRPPVDPA
jgi:hypothetical protein